MPRLRIEHNLSDHELVEVLGKALAGLRRDSKEHGLDDPNMKRFASGARAIFDAQIKIMLARISEVIGK